MIEERIGVAVSQKNAYDRRTVNWFKKKLFLHKTLETEIRIGNFFDEFGILIINEASKNIVFSGHPLVSIYILWGVKEKTN